MVYCLCNAVLLRSDQVLVRNHGSIAVSCSTADLHVPKMRNNKMIAKRSKYPNTLNREP